MFNRRPRSPLMRRADGMPVARAITAATSLAVTNSDTNGMLSSSTASLTSPDEPNCSSSASVSFGNCFSNNGIFSYNNCDAFAKSPFLSAAANSERAVSNSTCTRLRSSIAFFSFNHLSSNFFDFSSNLANSSSTSCKRCLEALSGLGSLRMACFSMARRIMRRSVFSSTSGFDSCCRRRREHASSITSMALSGKKRSVT
mmetsp:Transcript_12517/g.21115  ORF Transcript_12517/g.21115 Transcript_12517/m.21115 type:complete len:200 (-) Transcript_12517:1104-1703(-)